MKFNYILYKANAWYVVFYVSAAVCTHSTSMRNGFSNIVFI